MFVFSIRQDLDRIQRIFASCEAVGCLDTGVGGGGRCIYNCRPRMVTEKHTGRFVQLQEMRPFVYGLFGRCHE